MVISAGFCYALFGTLFIVCPIIMAVLFKREKTNKVLAYILLGLYLIALFIGVFTRASIKDGVFKVKLDYSAGWANKQIKFNILKTRKVDFLINSVLLFPFGVIESLFLTYRKEPIKKQILKILILGLIMGFAIEFTQFILPVSRAVQLSDLILNTISALIGGLYFMFFYWVFNLRKK